MKKIIKLCLVLISITLQSCIGFMGKQIDEKSSRYRKTPFGIVFASYSEASSDRWLDNVDVATFEVINENDARDKNKYWHYGIEVKGANPRTIVFIGVSFAKDDKTIFDKFLNNYEWREWTCGVDVNTAEFVAKYPECGLSSYIKDKAAVYYLNKRLDADIKTFRQLTDYGDIFVDSKSVYFNGDIVNSIDVSTIVIADNGVDFEDSNNYYKYDGDYKYRESEGVLHLPYTIIPK